MSAVVINCYVWLLPQRTSEHEHDERKSLDDCPKPGFV